MQTLNATWLDIDKLSLNLWLLAVKMWRDRHAIVSSHPPQWTRLVWMIRIFVLLASSRSRLSFVGVFITKRRLMKVVPNTSECNDSLIVHRAFKRKLISKHRCVSFHHSTLLHGINWPATHRTYRIKWVFSLSHLILLTFFIV